MQICIFYNAFLYLLCSFLYFMHSTILCTCIFCDFFKNVLMSAKIYPVLVLLKLVLRFELFDVFYATALTKEIFPPPWFNSCIIVVCYFIWLWKNQTELNDWRRNRLFMFLVFLFPTLSLLEDFVLLFKALLREYWLPEESNTRETHEYIATYLVERWDFFLKKNFITGIQ